MRSPVISRAPHRSEVDRPQNEAGSLQMGGYDLLPGASEVVFMDVPYVPSERTIASWDDTDPAFRLQSTSRDVLRTWHRQQT